MRTRSGFFRNQGLTIFMFGCFLIFFVGQVLTGREELNDERRKRGEPAMDVSGYVRSAHFFEATAENWESEFLAIGCMVVLSIVLREKNSPESKSVQTPHWDNEE